MSESSENKFYDKKIELARKNYEKQRASMQKIIASSEKRSAKSDERLEKAIAKTDERLEKAVNKTDERIKANRQRIEEKYIKGDKEKAEKFRQRTEKTDKYIEKQRAKRDERISTRRARIKKNRSLIREFNRLYLRVKNIRAKNKIKEIIKDRKNILTKKRIIFGAVSLLLIVALVFILEVILPGTKLKRDEIIDDTPIDELFSIDNVSLVPTKEYRTYIGINECDIIWNLLYDHFDGNETAVLGVMCNIMAESEFRACNLENYNNQIWEIGDDEYTEKINRRTINKKDFLEARNYDMTNGYYNKYDEWVNTDGGYGYAQYTSYDKKEKLYQYAEVWFAPGGPGEEYKFDIADPDMQAHYLVYILESDEYAKLDQKLRSASNVVDACYAWLKTYEIPYDPYNDNYYTLSFDRAENADYIKEICTADDDDTKESDDSVEEVTDEDEE